MTGAGRPGEPRRKVRTFLDAGVLIDAYKGKPAEREPALAILNDPARFFLSSRFLWLEIMPKAAYFRNVKEIAFYTDYFRNKVRVSIEEDAAAITEIAQEEAVRCGLGAMDALHVAAAHLGEADELVTVEKPGSAIYRASLVRVVCLAPVGSPR